MYLHDMLEDGCGGGETVFPAAGSSSTTVREAAAAVYASGATAVFADAFSGGKGAHAVACADAHVLVGGGSEATQGGCEAAPPPTEPPGKVLLDAGQRADLGVRVRPRRGGALVFWTMHTEGVDPYSFHNGVRVAPEAGGKWIAQKFKELPAAHRAARPLRLPSELAHPGCRAVGEAAPRVTRGSDRPVDRIA